ncbi:ATP-dependent RNA helicase DDX31-like protein [Perkinsela sp. CCAP 1560/4]|nr:ATP-dependent RNA helicase DDX31-like protein [Perkinsela sp. CCAP 1560/4]|eukprot:KNH03991.1 ATP-dependent RNA helicase DDX31-like protein [Perkinsela sp. CCAP 1560/4]
MVRKIEDLKLSSRVAQGVAKMGIEQLTPIQTNAWQLMMDPKVTDVIIHSETGSGKTLSYLLPLVELIISGAKIARKDGTILLIVVPVRELAQQTLDVCHQVLRYVPFLICGILVGGEKRTREKERLRKGQNILVATPGRLLDHVRTTQCMDLSRLQYLVVDEADRTLDEGFEADLRQLKSYLDEKQSYFGAVIRKKVLVSATLSEKILDLSYFILDNPKLVSSKDTCEWDTQHKKSTEEEDDDKPAKEGKNKASLPFIFPDALEQRFTICSPKRKVVTMLALLYWIFTNDDKKEETKKAIVFSNSFSCVDFFHLIASIVTNPFRNGTHPTGNEGLLKDVKFHKVHKEMSQLDRAASCAAFIGSSRAVLFCTDVASRGLHFDNVTDVIHFDAPLCIETYIHRTGRTARIGHKGTSHLLLYPHEEEYVDFLVRQGVVLTKRHTSILFYKMMKNDSSQIGDLLDGEILLQRSFQDAVRGAKEAYEAGKNAFHGWRKSYSAYPVEQRKYFDSTKLHLRNISRSFGVDT